MKGCDNMNVINTLSCYLLTGILLYVLYGVGLGIYIGTHEDDIDVDKFYGLLNKNNSALKNMERKSLLRAIIRPIFMWVVIFPKSAVQMIGMLKECKITK